MSRCYATQDLKKNDVTKEICHMTFLKTFCTKDFQRCVARNQRDTIAFSNPGFNSIGFTKEIKTCVKKMQGKAMVSAHKDK